MRQAPSFEEMLLESGIHVTKLWFSVTQQEQRTRFAVRQLDPVRRWKLSPMDLESLDKWEAYTEAKEEMFLRTDTDHAPWYTVKSNDKKRARINALRLFLSLVDYDGKDRAGRAEAGPEARPARTRHGRGLSERGPGRRASSGGQGRGRTADLPIFSRTLVPTELPGRGRTPHPRSARAPYRSVSCWPKPAASPRSGRGRVRMGP